MPVTIPLGVRSRLSIGQGWDDGPPDAGVREPRRPPPSPLQGAAELPEPD